MVYGIVACLSYQVIVTTDLDFLRMFSEHSGRCLDISWVSNNGFIVGDDLSVLFLFEAYHQTLSLNSVTVPTTSWIIVANVINLYVSILLFGFLLNLDRKVWDVFI